MSNESMANSITDVPCAIAELLAVNKQLEQQLSKAQADLEVSVNLLNELLAETVHREECESMHSEDDDEELTCNCGEYARSVKVRLFIEQIKEKKDE